MKTVFLKKGSEQPLVSILIISYNQKEFIGDALTGALEQNYENLEVVVADDGSTDGTAEVILKFAEKYPGRLVALVGGPNLGITGNSNRALGACKGKYVAFQGGDDIMLPGKISSQVEWLEDDENRVLCGHGVEVIRPDGYVDLVNPSRRECTGRGYLEFIEGGRSPLKTVSIMVRASKIPAYGFDERVILVSDWKLWVDCLGENGIYGIVDGFFARYRLHGNNVTATHGIDCLQDGIQIFKSMMEEQENKYAVKVLRRNIANNYLLLTIFQVREKDIVAACQSAKKGLFLDLKVFSSGMVQLFYRRMKRMWRGRG